MRFGPADFSPGLSKHPGLFFFAFVQSDDAIEVGEESKAPECEFRFQAGAAAGNPQAERSPERGQEISGNKEPFPEVMASPSMEDPGQMVMVSEPVTEVDFLEDALD